MKVYKNPFVSYDSYFVKTGNGKSAKGEAPYSNGYIVEFRNNKWNVRKGCYYNYTLNNDMLVVGENRVSIDRVIKNAVLMAVLDLIHNTSADIDKIKRHAIYNDDYDI